MEAQMIESDDSSVWIPAFWDGGCMDDDESAASRAVSVVSNKLHNTPTILPSSFGQLDGYRPANKASNVVETWHTDFLGHPFKSTECLNSIKTF
jgi:hypothetical protein